MKVLFWTHSSGKRGMYGGDVCLLNLAKELNKTIDVAVAFPSEGMLVDAMRKAGVKVYVLRSRYGLTTFPNPKYVPWYKYPVRLFKQMVRRRIAMYYLDRLVREYQPDIIHTNVGPLDHAHFIAAKHGIPHVWHLREYQDKDFNMHFIPSMRKFRKLIKHPNNHCITITKDIFRHFNLDEARDCVIYDGVFEAKGENKKADKQPYFLFVGRLEAAKGLDTLIEAYTSYIRQGGTYKLLVAGGVNNPDHVEHCRQMVSEAGLDEKVDFLGFRSDCYDLMAHASALIVPSHFEGFGFITAEGMYNNCLVIGRDTAGTKEQFDNGLALTGQEIALRFTTNEQLTRHLLDVEHNGQAYYADMIARAFTTVNHLYTLDEDARQVKQFYNKVLHQSS